MKTKSAIHILAKAQVQSSVTLPESSLSRAVRAWIQAQPNGHGGWLGALRDKHIVEALNLIHQKPNTPWTIAKLAAEVGMSRSRTSLS